MHEWTMIAPLTGLVGLIIAGFIYLYIKKQPRGTPLMQEAEGMIHEGAMTFLKREYSALALFVICVVPILWFFYREWYTPGAFISGFLCAITAVYIGVKSATRGYSRTAEAADKSGPARAVGISYFSGSVMGLSVAGLGLLGLGAWCWKLAGDPGIIRYLNGFTMGASCVALFVRIGGGIFAKAADLGSELAARIEAGISKNDHRSPGAVANNVGDTAGNIAGMGADLFESYVASMIASMAIGAAITAREFTEKFPGLKDRDEGAVLLLFVGLPLLIAVAGQISSFIGIFFIRAFHGKRPAAALRPAMSVTGIVFIALAALVIGLTEMPWGMLWAVISGVVCAVALGLLAEYSTSGPSVSRISEQARYGHAAVITSGIILGLRSTCLPFLVICAATFAGYLSAGVYGLGLTAVGMVAAAGVALTVDACGSIAENAGGISGMAGPGISKRNITGSLDRIGNAAAAMGKGFASGSAVLAGVALFAAYARVAGLQIINIMNPTVLSGIFLGAMLPVFVASGIMASVGKTALKVVEEIRRQYREIPGLLEGREGVKPDPVACVSMAAWASIRESAVPVLTALLCPIAAGVLFGTEVLGGVILGTAVMGLFLALFMSNAGGAWDNASKYIEAGNFGGKGSNNNRAAVVGGMVGAPFKDASGPAMNTFLKATAIVALIIAPFLSPGGFLGL